MLAARCLREVQLLAHLGLSFAIVAAILLQRCPVPATCPCTLSIPLGSGRHTLPYVVQGNCRMSAAG